VAPDRPLPSAASHCGRGDDDDRFGEETKEKRTGRKGKKKRRRPTDVDRSTLINTVHSTPTVQAIVPGQKREKQKVKKKKEI